MSEWLDTHKARLDKEYTDRKSAEDVEITACRNRTDACAKRAKYFYDQKLKSLSGKDTALGKITVVYNYQDISINAGDTTLASIHFHWMEGTRYENDDSGWPSGEFYDHDTMWLYRPWVDKHNNQRSGGTSRALFEPELAEYLLYFIRK